MPKGFINTDRTVLRVTGADRLDFLEGLLSNTVLKLADGPVYAAMLGPQGKYLFDMIVSQDGDGVLLDVKSDRAQALALRLTMYRLRADVVIADAELPVVQGIGATPEGAFIDPRTPELGWRMYGAAPAMEPMETAEWDALRVIHVVPETCIELIPDDTYILEAGFERLHGVDFRKGCYVGQEVTARMKHKTELKKGLVQVRLDGAATPGTPITTDGKAAGTLFTVAGNTGLAHLRFDRANGDMQVGDAVVRRV